VRGEQRRSHGGDLRDFVNGKLFPYLHGFKQDAIKNSDGKNRPSI
jgi:hypothetical protein